MRRTQSEQLTDLYFNTPLKRVGLLDWRRFDQAVLAQQSAPGEAQP